MQGKRVTNLALELKANLKAIFRYCTAHYSLFIPVAPTARNVTQLWTSSVYTVSLTAITQQQFHLQHCVFQTVLSDLKLSCLQKQRYQNMYLKYSYSIHFTDSTVSCTLNALYWKNCPTHWPYTGSIPQLWSTTTGTLESIFHCVVYKLTRNICCFAAGRFHQLRSIWGVRTNQRRRYM